MMLREDESDGLRRFRGRVSGGSARALCAVLACVAGGAAEARCASHGALVSGLAQSHGEYRVAVALHLDGHLVEVFASADGATWTLLMTTPDGTACMVAAGTDYSARAPRPAGQEG